MIDEEKAARRAGAGRASWRDRRWVATGVGWGVTTGVSPMPKPIPIALVAHTLGALPMPMPVLLVLGLVAHLSYGGAGGLVFAAVARRANWVSGLAYGLVLWLLMDLVWLPYLGWGLFGTAITPAIAVATLVLHLIYGATLGGLLGRFHPAPGRALGRGAPGATR